MGGGRGRILVVDDDPLVARLVSRLLEHCGFEPQQAASLAAARAALAGGGFVAVLLDNALEDGSGLDFAAEIATPGSPPVVMMSGAPDVLTAARLRLGIATLNKPMTREQLLAALAQAGL